MATIRCPTCENSFDSQKSEAMPFCSPRCRQIDLGRWLSEQHSIPYVRVDEEAPDDDAAPSYRDGAENGDNPYS